MKRMIQTAVINFVLRSNSVYTSKTAERWKSHKLTAVVNTSYTFSNVLATSIIVMCHFFDILYAAEHSQVETGEECWRSRRAGRGVRVFMVEGKVY